MAIMGISSTPLPYPRKPQREHDERLYSNLDHVLNLEVVEFLALNQDHCAVHAAKLFCGYVYACCEEEFPIRWYEEVWVNRERAQIYRSSNLQNLILRVCDDYGDA